MALRAKKQLLLVKIERAERLRQRLASRLVGGVLTLILPQQQLGQTRVLQQLCQRLRGQFVSLQRAGIKTGPRPDQLQPPGQLGEVDRGGEGLFFATEARDVGRLGLLREEKRAPGRVTAQILRMPGAVRGMPVGFFEKIPQIVQRSPV